MFFPTNSLRNDDPNAAKSDEPSSQSKSSCCRFNHFVSFAFVHPAKPQWQGSYPSLLAIFHTAHDVVDEQHFVKMPSSAAVCVGFNNLFSGTISTDNLNVAPCIVHPWTATRKNLSGPTDISFDDNNSACMNTSSVPEPCQLTQSYQFSPGAVHVDDVHGRLTYKSASPSMTSNVTSASLEASGMAN